MSGKILTIKGVWKPSVQIQIPSILEGGRILLEAILDFKIFKIAVMNMWKASVQIQILQS